MLTAILRYDDKKLTLIPQKTTIVPELYTMWTVENTGGGTRYKIDINPKQDIVIQSLTLEIPMRMHPFDDKFLCNGFQSWSETREYTVGEKIDKLRWFAQPLMGNYGDYHIKNLPENNLYSWSWAYVRTQSDDKIRFAGSLNESTGFTHFEYDIEKQVLRVVKDIENLHLQHSLAALDIFLCENTQKKAFETYFDLLGLKPKNAPKTVGWTSWYNYYTNIDADIILKNLVSQSPYSLAYFQIDDGWQTRVGDWLSVKDSFPQGMSAMSAAIHQRGFKAGLWLAPFIVEPKSKIFQEKKDWILRGGDGKPVKAGFAPHWSGWGDGWFYALDFYNPEVQDWLGQVFYTVLNKWGFDMVKLDFLYAACILPRKNKTRGQVMHDVMQFLRNTVGDKKILACGVPLASAFGLVDFCRIGADIHLEWEHNLLKTLQNRERVSTILALRNTLNRWQLNNIAFQNDPDVIILRDRNHQLTSTQQYTIAVVNQLLGNVLFTSDDVGTYTEGGAAKGIYEGLFALENIDIQEVIEIKKDIYRILFLENNISKKAFVNLTNKEIVVENTGLQAYETKILA